MSRAAQQDRQLVLAPARILAAQLEHRLLQRCAPTRLTQTPWPPRATLQRGQVARTVSAQPAIESLRTDIEMSAGPPRIAATGPVVIQPFQPPACRHRKPRLHPSQPHPAASNRASNSHRFHLSQVSPMFLDEHSETEQATTEPHRVHPSQPVLAAPEKLSTRY